MAPLEDASAALGRYLLQGWTMMNEACAICHTPLMRSPDRTQLICVIHDSQDAGAAVASSQASSNSRASASRPSTPPTPLSDSPSSTFVLPEPSAETLRRRQQSDTASHRIGQKMLQGYAMLAEECPNPECIGVPLIRPPRRDGTKDPNKECVICGNIYVEARDSRGRVSLQLLDSPAANTSHTPSDPQPPLRPPAVVIDASAALPSASNGRRHAAPGVARNLQVVGGLIDHGKVTPDQPPPSSHVPRIGSVDALSNVMASLDKSLDALSSRLQLLSDAPPSTLNPLLIGETASQIEIILRTRQVAQQADGGRL